MRILIDEIKEKIQDLIICRILREEYGQATNSISDVLGDLYTNIPDNRRISYGRVHTIKVLSKYLYSQLTKIEAPIYQIALSMFEESGSYKGKGVSLGMLSFYGLDDYEKVFPHFRSAASSPDWNMREMAQMFFRKLIQKYPDEMKEYLLHLVRSRDANIRRFVGETLRPVQENSWFYNDPDYPLPS